MKIFKGKVFMTGFILMAVLLVNLLVAFPDTQAAAAPKEVIQLNAAIPLADNLVAMKGKTVSIALSSGQTVTGVVKEVQSNLAVSRKAEPEGVLRRPHPHGSDRVHRGARQVEESHGQFAILDELVDHRIDRIAGFSSA